MLFHMLLFTFIVVSKLILGSVILDFDELNSITVICESLVIDVSVDIFRISIYL